VCLCSKKASLSGHSELCFFPTDEQEQGCISVAASDSTFSCDTPHMPRTVDEKTLVAKTSGERWWQWQWRWKDTEGWQSPDFGGRRQI
jgi:hypothetical protein